MGRSRAKDLDAGCSVGVGHGDLSERVATIDEQPATGHQTAAQPGKRKRLSLASRPSNAPTRTAKATS